MEWNLRIPLNKSLARFDPVATEQVSAQSNQKFGKRCRKLIFKIAAVAANLDFPIGYFVSTRRPNAHHQVSIQLDYKGDAQNKNSQHFPHVNV